MAAILVDYENVFSMDGLKGIEYLTKEDALHIFYSQCCGQIKTKYMEAIENCGCSFQIHKLVKTGKNALDFYIAAECGVLSQKGEGAIVIISKDKGFTAVSDFFQNKDDNKGTVVITASNIEEGLEKINVSSNEQRRKLLKDKNKMLGLEQEHARYCKHKVGEETMKVELDYPGIDMEKTGERLKKLAEKAGYSPKQIQEYLQLSCPQPIYRWFKGQILPSLDHLYALSMLFHVHMENMLVSRKEDGIFRKIEDVDNVTAKGIYYTIGNLVVLLKDRNIIKLC